MQNAPRVALKEWQVVCDLLGEGSQVVLLRKGGIQEGQNRFDTAHRQFALLPTRLHQDPAMLKPAFQSRIDAEVDEPATFKLTHAGQIVDILPIHQRDQMDRIDDLHCWAEPYIDMRFNYRPERPLFLLLIRVFALERPFELRNTYEVAGCRSWVPLPDAPKVTGPVLSDGDFQRCLALIRARIEG